MIVYQEDVGRNDCKSDIRWKECLFVRKALEGIIVCQENVGRNNCRSGRRWKE